MKVKSLNCVQLLETPWTVAHQAPLSMGFARQEYWSGVPLPSPQEYWSGLLIPLRESCSPCSVTAQPRKDYHNSASEKPLYFELLVSSHGTFVYNSLSQLPFLLSRVFSPLFYPHLHVIHHNHTKNWVAILCCSQINLFYW